MMTKSYVFYGREFGVLIEVLPGCSYIYRPASRTDRLLYRLTLLRAWFARRLAPSSTHRGQAGEGE